MEVITSIICDLTAQSLKVVEVTHNDSGSRRVACLLRAYGEPWRVPEGVTAAVGYTLPDGTPGLYAIMPDSTAAAVIDGSTVTVQLSDQILSASGAVDVTVELWKGLAKLHTFPFRVNVIGWNPLSNPETYPTLGAGFDGKLLYGGPGGRLLPLEPGPGLEIAEGVLRLKIAASGEGVSIRTDADGVLRVYLDGVEIPMEIDGEGYAYWPGLTASVGADGLLTLGRS